MFITLLAIAAALESPPPAPEISTIVIPIRTSLAPLLPQLESQVPKNLSKTDAFELDPKKQFGMKYRVARDPIVLNVIGSGIHAMTTVHYALEGCRRTQKPFSGEIVMWPCISCGFGEPMRDAWISFSSHLEWDANWRLRSVTRASPVDFSSNRCQVTFANIDITDWKIGPIVNEQLRQTVKTIDANTPRLTNIRPAATQVWSALQSPIAIGPPHLAGHGSARRRPRADLRIGADAHELADAARADARRGRRAAAGGAKAAAGAARLAGGQ